MTFLLIDSDLSGFSGTPDLLGAPKRGWRGVSAWQKTLHLSAAHKRVGSSQLRSFGLPAFNWKGEN
ncbi:hypothetical protein [Rhizobium sp. 1399]|uniref:hypothetical protein n=1 Tax=Rhizobium sp. 1399 TaxID=2817758 RepID=UPI00286306A6|nr:hypothetical protein [Rhizobium sp. 1399]MDR6665024.1 hypothetical protein [Rhizobium sp. 1399]